MMKDIYRFEFVQFSAKVAPSSLFPRVAQKSRSAESLLPLKETFYLQSKIQKDTLTLAIIHYTSKVKPKKLTHLVTQGQNQNLTLLGTL